MAHKFNLSFTFLEKYFGQFIINNPKRLCNIPILTVLLFYGNMATIMQTVKTTVEISPNLLYLAKLKALKERKTLKEVIQESLAKDLGIPAKKLLKEKKVKIGGYRLGGVKGSLRRIDIYENL